MKKKPKIINKFQVKIVVNESLENKRIGNVIMHAMDLYTAHSRHFSFSHQ